MKKVTDYLDDNSWDRLGPEDFPDYDWVDPSDDIESIPYGFQELELYYGEPDEPDEFEEDDNHAT